MPGKRIVELDGVRGMAALVVVVSHFFGEVAHGTRLFSFGWLGVDVFFVLSGFLIGSIILEQHEKPRFLRIFYLKRAARIIPVYAVVCIFALIAAALTAGHVWSDHPYGAGVYGAFGTNIAMSLFGGGGEWLRPTWTLDVEEQFYLIMPILICFTPRKFLPPLLIALWISATAARFALHGTNPLAALSLLPCRMDLLLSGVMIALLNRSFDLSRYLTFLRVAPLIALLVLVALVAISPFTFFLVFGGTLASIAIACFLLAIIHGAPEAARFRSPVLRYFGQISYALYLVHQPISGLLHGLLLNSVPDIGTPAQVGVTLASVAISIGVAAASWKWLESPILSWAQTGYGGRSIMPVKTSPAAGA
jgi:peptidoglycan/LPS O-acetylase OafA/YrhL